MDNVNCKMQAHARVCEVIKTRGSESRGQEEAACVHHQAYATTTVSYLHR